MEHQPQKLHKVQVHSNEINSKEKYYEHALHTDTHARRVLTQQILVTNEGGTEMGVLNIKHSEESTGCGW